MSTPTATNLSGAVPLPQHDPTFADIEAAAARLSGYATLTPLLPVHDVAVGGGGRLFVKAECLQRTGSFKFRGAFNRLSMIPEAARGPGVVACSSGNHAQGVAAAAEILGMPAVIVMPRDAPAIKIRNTEGYGARVVLYDRRTEDRDVIARAICAETGATFVHPYDDPGVMAGQGTTGLELVRQLADLGRVPDVVLVCASGGGLTAGISLAVERLAPGCAVYTVEPAGFDDHARSLAGGVRVRNAEPDGSICDALMAATPGLITFSVNGPRVAGGLTVSDDEALAAVAFAARRLKLVVEPGGAVALAAALTGKLPLEGKTVVAIVSGGNVDDAMIVRALAG
ncbi:threonine ammonia-lyase [Methylobrevis albus]|uniref:Threonine/serine dehydratase n=1 Tax=Methylobrevis albus TaxID=2793297 RepID=A0A931HZ88_9HYPH|nr:threonine/serine dehydratase [Methylobrevis albus]MBH0236817.1 threonine/serine dehydratase [Methylobrevis albus]